MLRLPVDIHQAGTDLLEQTYVDRTPVDTGDAAAFAPDFGPKKLGPAGATAIGARYPLIAYNIYLGSKDVRIAKAIARAVRGEPKASEVVAKRNEAKHPFAPN